ncbi:MAG: hypothetical protein AAFW74_03845 [Pseudomonadota bacterium]
MRNDRHSWLLLTAGGIILAGSAHTPVDMYDLATQLGFKNTGFHILLIMLFVCAVLAAYVPFALGLVHFLTGKVFSLGLGFSLVVATFVFGGILTLLSTAFSGPGFGITLLHGCALISGVAGAILWITAKRPAGWITVPARALVAVSVLAACWSLASIPAALTQAGMIADDRPFCLAHHGSGPVTSIADLRGFRFYTDKTGYKSTSRWYFHGTMTVRGPEGDLHYNWSPRRFRFELIESPQLMHARVNNDCDPEADNWQFSRLR